MKRIGIYTILLFIWVKGFALNYLSSSAVDSIKILSSSTDPQFTQTKVEIETILQQQKSRSSEDERRAQSEVKLRVYTFTNIIGKWVTPKKASDTDLIFQRIDQDVKEIVMIAKEHWDRPRPYYFDERVKPCIKLEKTFSYPSGHATRAFVYGRILSHLFPDKTEQLMERAWQISWDRVIGGVHYPTDVKAGKELGEAIAQQLLNSSKLKNDLAQVQKGLN